MKFVSATRFLVAPIGAAVAFAPLSPMKARSIISSRSLAAAPPLTGLRMAANDIAYDEGVVLNKWSRYEMVDSLAFSFANGWLSHADCFFLCFHPLGF